MSNKQKTGSKLQGISRLITDATIGITDLVESMHRRIVHPPFLPSTPIQHLITDISGIVYNNIRWSTRFIGSGVDNVLGQFATVSGKIKTTAEREALQAVLNGVVGDYLEKTENPLQIEMQLRYEANTVLINKKSLEKAFPSINGKILLMVHGSCMNDIQWTRNDHNHGTALGKELQKTPIYLLYNSGLHISSNGQSLNELLEKLVLHWPVPVEELIIVAHSMGGLVSRSALHYGEEQQKTWTKHLKKIIFLGTPHHGASLEQAGNYVDVVLEAVPYAKPFARLGKIRSAGVTDLRYGSLVDEDWKDIDRFKMGGDQRQSSSLPKKIDCYAIAGVVGKDIKSGSTQLLGDNMVGLKSALGQHSDPAKNLNFKKKNTWIAFENNHMDLLSNKEIYSKIKTWMLL
ncbi:PGAP1-like alpha/beta domain-containing protein [Ulvibacter antarcticus]|uniref:PGAP1-like protein n=1 Tax=Ulvibacter antarcticus TaxID=442714 RepID=A0A3L9YVV6_9FLAO|nr:alpha/beta hydrolase [Ulvibacter antarcticus]RMA64806.1 PGAP1-like protein [Ulvibacter antarcticus]